MDLQEEKQEEIFRMEASASSLLIVNIIGGIVAGGVLLFFLLAIRGLYASLIFIVMLLALALYFIIDYLRWRENGIRVIEIDESGINVYRGEQKQLSRIEASQITDINVFKKINRKVVNIILGGKVHKVLPGVTLFSGPRLRITNDAFEDKDFNTFVDRLKKLKNTIKV
ncbi:hypothetical protein KAW65_01485 [candidate division WOR-3 bacterium]|nr:hypothetical protein [candidate division WOR-3 bacterium]